jgi:hypothetical protein
MPSRVSATMPTLSGGMSTGFTAHRHCTWIFTPGLRVVTTSRAWSTLIRSEHGSLRLSKGPR